MACVLGVEADPLQRRQHAARGAAFLCWLPLAAATARALRRFRGHLKGSARRRPGHQSLTLAQPNTVIESVQAVQCCDTSEHCDRVSQFSHFEWSLFSHFEWSLSGSSASGDQLKGFASPWSRSDSLVFMHRQFKCISSCLGGSRTTQPQSKQFLEANHRTACTIWQTSPR